MTPAQRELARHALGLNSRNRRSYRNHFVAGKGHIDYAEWLALTAQGDAARIDGGRLAFGGDDLFRLTRKGAEAALEPGESLDPEDFPEGATSPYPSSPAEKD